MDLESNANRAFVRHMIATLAYRGAKAVSGAPDDFSRFRVGESSRTPGEILAHIGDLLDWALSLVKGQQSWHDSPPQEWDKDADRFFLGLKKLDDALDSGDPIHCELEKLFQGPVADAFTHVGQISMLRRLAGAPVRGENYYKARIVSGHTDPDHPGPRAEF